MREILKNLMNLDRPVLIEKLAPKIAPYARGLYLIILLVLGIMVVSSLGMLLIGYVGFFLVMMFWVIVQFIIVRICCEYLTNAPQQKKE